MHLVSTEDVEYQPFVGVWELDVLGEDHSLEPMRKMLEHRLNMHTVPDRFFWTV